SGITSTKSCPLARQTKANPMPVFPLVGSITILLPVNCPDFSASSIMYLAIRSLTDPPGLHFSNLTYILTLGLGFKRLISTIGVLPISSSTFFAFIFKHRKRLILISLLQYYKLCADKAFFQRST